jgi:hypothetical protein
MCIICAGKVQSDEKLRKVLESQQTEDLQKDNPKRPDINRIRVSFYANEKESMSKLSQKFIQV